MFNLFKKQKNQKDSLNNLDKDSFDEDINESADSVKFSDVGDFVRQKKSEINKLNSSLESLEEEKDKKIEELGGKKTKSSGLKNYKDPEGLSLGKMSLGLWLVKNRKKIISLFYIFLGSIGVVTWSIFFYTFGGYVIFGMRNDASMVNELLSLNVDHGVVINQSPRELQYEKLYVLKLDDGKYDFYIKITNVNERHAAEFNYFIQSGEEKIGLSSGVIFPKESKYFLVLNQEPGTDFNNPRFVVEDLKWERLSYHDYVDWDRFYSEHLDFEIKDIKFTQAQDSPLSEKINLNEVEFVVTNNSAYSYWQIDFDILLLNRSQIVAVDRYTADQFFSGETRDFKSTWPGKMPKVTNIIVTPSVNIIDDNVFITPR